MPSALLSRSPRRADAEPRRWSPLDGRLRRSRPRGSWDKALEVRDKPVTLADIQIFANKCLAEGVREAAVVADGQPALDRSRLGAWASELGIGVTAFFGWPEIVEQALFWASDPKLEASRRAVRHVHDRLVEVEATREAVDLWSRLTARRGDRP